MAEMSGPGPQRRPDRRDASARSKGWSTACATASTSRHRLRAGHAINLMAEAFPKSRFTGLDISEHGDRAATAEAAELRVDERHLRGEGRGRPRRRRAVRPRDRVRRRPRPGESRAELAGDPDALRLRGVFLCVDIAASSHPPRTSTTRWPRSLRGVDLPLHDRVARPRGAGLGTMWGDRGARRPARRRLRCREIQHVEADILNDYYICEEVMTRDERVMLAAYRGVHLQATADLRRRHGTAIRRGTRLADAQPHRRPRPERAGHRSRARRGARRDRRRRHLLRGGRSWRAACGIWSNGSRAAGSSSLGWGSMAFHRDLTSPPVAKTSLRLVEVDGETAEMFGRVVATGYALPPAIVPTCARAHARLGWDCGLVTGGRRAVGGSGRGSPRAPSNRRDAARASGQGGAERTPVRPHPARSRARQRDGP